ncbi:MAG: hypothetical protein CBD88_01110 [Flavobacteriales bacterium TMED228]|nr:MAG: hypothetical protein CBD88_01110 [Flavobacteriales bacterium TMED228]
MIKVEGHKNLFRDENSGAIIDIDNRAYASYMTSKNRKLDQKAELDEMKKDINEIKSLLKQLTKQIT